MRSQVKVKQIKLIQKKRRNLLVVCLSVMAVCALTVSFFSWLSYRDAFTLTNVLVRGDVRVKHADIENVVAINLAGAYGGLFSRSNALIYPRETLEKELLTIPLIKTAQVSRSAFNTLVVTVTERMENALFCKDMYVDCFSVDEQGFIFASVPDHVASSSRMLVYSDESIEQPLGVQLLEPKQFTHLAYFMNQVQKLDIDPVRVRMASTSNHIIIDLAKGAKVFVDRGGDLTPILENISTVLRDPLIAPSFSQFLTRLEYIKFDGGNKVVYKMRGEAETGDKTKEKR